MHGDRHGVNILDQDVNLVDLPPVACTPIPSPLTLDGGADSSALSAGWMEVVPMDVTVSGTAVTLLRPESSYFFDGGRRKRPVVALSAAAVLVLTFGAAAGLFISNLEIWQKTLARATNGEDAVATYTSATVEGTPSADEDQSIYYFRFSYHVDGRRYEGQHQVDLVTYRRGIPVGGQLAVVYDRNDPANVHAVDAPPPPPWLQTAAVLLLVVGGVVVAVLTWKDYNRPYDPVKDGRLAAATLSDVRPGTGDLEVHFRYRSPFGGRETTGVDRVPLSGAARPEPGMKVGVLVRGSGKATLL